MKIGIIKIAATLLLSMFVLSNCTVQERKYRKGFYVNVKHKVNEKAGQSKKEDPLAGIAINVKAEEELGCKQELVASIVKTTPPIPKPQPLKTKETKSDSCGDLIIMLDGAIIEARVIEVNQSNVKYKKCNNLNGPTYISVLEKIERIQYKNGSQDIVDAGANPSVRFVPTGSQLKYNIISESKVNQQKNLVSENRKTEFNQSAIASLIFGITSFFIPVAILTGPVAFITGVVALIQMRNGRGNRGRGMAIFGVAVGSIVLAILLILIPAFVL